MTVKVILDTDILSEYLKGYNASVAERAAAYAQEHGGWVGRWSPVIQETFGRSSERASS